MENKKSIYEFQIEYPDDNEIKTSINSILDIAVEETPSPMERIRRMLVGPGLHVVFYQANLTILLSILVYALVAMLCESISRYVLHTEYIVLMLFPILHLSFFSLSLWNEEQAEVVELKMTLKYSFSYIVSIRMFYMSFLSAVINSVTLLQLNSFKEIAKIGSLGFSSVFIFAVISLFLYERFGRYYHIAIMAVIWMVGCILLAKYGAGISYVLFEVIPLTVYVISVIGCFFLLVGYIGKVEKKNAYA